MKMFLGWLDETHRPTVGGISERVARFHTQMREKTEYGGIEAF